MTEEKPKHQAVLYILIHSTPQSDINKLGFEEWLRVTRQHFCERFDTDRVTLHVAFGKVTAAVSKLIPLDEIKMDLNTWKYAARNKLQGEYGGIVFVVT